MADKCMHYHSYYQNKFELRKGILPDVEWLFPRLLIIPLIHEIIILLLDF